MDYTGLYSRTSPIPTDMGMEPAGAFAASHPTGRHSRKAPFMYRMKSLFDQGRKRGCITCGGAYCRPGQKMLAEL
jgi:hypothetical protein